MLGQDASYDDDIDREVDSPADDGTAESIDDGPTVVLAAADGVNDCCEEGDAVIDGGVDGVGVRIDGAGDE